MNISPISICRECEQVLTEKEAHYYGRRCERCEREHWERVKAWHEGGEDKELDEIFGATRPMQ